MKIGVLATMVFTISIGLPVASFAGLAPDTDGDGVPDVLDNCSALSNPGSLDCDTDQDGYGNRCDCDLTQSGANCALTDVSAFKAGFVGKNNLNADTNCSGTYTLTDVSIFKAAFINDVVLLNTFKSGLSCADPDGVPACPN